MTIVRLLGGSGRVGGALGEHLAKRWQVDSVPRRDGETVAALASRAAVPDTIVVNAAGVAHLADEAGAALDRLRVANVQLPAELGRACLDVGCSLVHISSSKAETPDESAYAASKREGDDALEELGAVFAERGLSIVSIRPPALLFPPLDAGKVRRLEPLGRLPSAIVPAIRLPVLGQGAFLGAVEQVITSIDGGAAEAGFTVRSFGRGERGTLRDVAAAFRA